MISINQKTLKDLEFQTVLNTVSSHCVTDIGIEKTLAITPIAIKEDLLNSLKQTSEYLSSFSNNNALPNHGFENINQDLKFLAIEDSFLEATSFKKISIISETTNNLLQFLKKFNDYYPEQGKSTPVDLFRSTGGSTQISSSYSRLLSSLEYFNVVSGSI